MLDKLLDWFIPHICSSCGEVGSLLCASCEYDIVDQSFLQCIVCLKPSYADNLCRACQKKLPFQEAYVVSWRDGPLKALIDAYKFERAKAAAEVLSSLLDKSLPVLPEDTIVCYIPTVPSHIRQRGFDHMRVVAQLLAKRRDLELYSPLKRSSSTIQHGSSRAQRLEQAKTAFSLQGAVPNRPVVLLDDIYTTGATVTEAAKLIRRETDQTIILAIIARQPLDDLSRL